MNLNTKDFIQYTAAIGLIVSGILIAFLSFFLNNYMIANSILMYIAEAFVSGGGLLGCCIYVKTEIGEFSSNSQKLYNKIIERIEKLEKLG